MLKKLSFALLSGALLYSSDLARAQPPSQSNQARSFPAPPINGRAGVAMDAASGSVLASKNAHLRLPMASTTKIMTAVLALQMGKLTDRIKVPKSAFNFESDATVMGLHPGQVVSLHDLLYGLLLPSGADAANTIAIHYGKSEAHFVALMNQEAKVLGMRDTHYANTHGLTAPNHYTTAYDLALLAEYASSLPEFMKVVGTKTYSWNGHLLINLNKVLFWYPGLDGIKPGFTDDAGICQVLDARRHNQHVIVTLLNTPNLDIDARNLLNFALRDFTWVKSNWPEDRPSRFEQGMDRYGAYTYFPASGHFVRGNLWRGYLANGGLGTLGFPRTEPLTESQGRLQYFENGALAVTKRGKVKRLAIGLTPLPGTTLTPLPATATATPTAFEGTVPHGLSRSETNVSRDQSAAAAAQAQSTPTPSGSKAIAGVFVSFQKSHVKLLGKPASSLFNQNGYALQIFAYGALAYRRHVVYLLPIGDRLLAARHYLPAHPGNTYPVNFAPQSILKAIGWAPYGKTSSPSHKGV
jgi:D-alanyl-D-alanine carboxypeptidase